MMTNNEMQNLQVGDVVRMVSGSGMSFVITANYGTRVTAVRTVDITNPREWEIVMRCKSEPVDA